MLNSVEIVFKRGGYFIAFKRRGLVRQILLLPPGAPPDYPSIEVFLKTGILPG